MSLPTTMKAVVIDGDKPVVKQVPLPPLEDGYFLIKTKAVAGNPTDWKHIESKIGPQGSILGCDAVGDIVKLGPNVDAKEFKVGDKVFGFIHGASVRFPINGAFAEYVSMDSKLAYFCPPNTTITGKESLSEGPVNSYESCATLPVSLTTAGLALTHNLGNKLEWEPKHSQHKFPILLWGGATAIGQLLIQLAKRLNCYSKIVVVASKQHETQLKAYGADELFDYHDADVIHQIKSKYPNLQHLIDCVSNRQTIQQVYKCASEVDSATVLQLTDNSIENIKPEDRRDNVKITGTMLYLATGHDVPFGPITVPKDLVYRENAIKFINFITPKLHDGTIHHIPVKIYHGLEGAVQITDDIKNGKNSGEKLVSVL
ncbi:hypothetical protein DAKH74_007210 [Maudiozyma humilis]|uniref:Enoyl reductase (ER) domain-containing protein n=1 Tax=Maudiozyma humilis TaxID=51915 RepID=A0AAV5RRM9_MAUHU|nr:hypothetical protein DAKH74_007210 [Kazachstania humilis]